MNAREEFLIAQHCFTKGLEHLKNLNDLLEHPEKDEGGLPSKEPVLEPERARATDPFVPKKEGLFARFLPGKKKRSDNGLEALT